jgi:hypothetical protein
MTVLEKIIEYNNAYKKYENDTYMKALSSVEYDKLKLILLFNVRPPKNFNGIGQGSSDKHKPSEWCKKIQDELRYEYDANDSSIDPTFEHFSKQGVLSWNVEDNLALTQDLIELIDKNKFIVILNFSNCNLNKLIKHAVVINWTGKQPKNCFLFANHFLKELRYTKVDWFI